MKAAYILQTGPPENIHYGEVADPRPGAGQVLVRIEATDVNPIDVYVRSGMLPAPLTMPYILGRDLAGVVAEVGPKATRFRVGDKVWGSNQGQGQRPGTFAELAAVDEQWLYPIPSGADSRQMAALSLVALTATLGLTDYAMLKSGETLFVNGGTGGIGSTVIQMATAIGARVITTAGSEEKLQLCRELGAALAINYKTEDVAARVKEFNPRGVNVWWETVREPDFDRIVSLLALRGRVVVMAGRDARPSFPVGPFYVKGCSLHGLALFNAGVDEQRQAAELINGWVAAGKLKANIDRVLPLSEAAAAHRLQEENTLHGAGTLTGKIVLVP